MSSHEYTAKLMFVTAVAMPVIMSVDVHVASSLLTPWFIVYKGAAARFSRNHFVIY